MKGRHWILLTVLIFTFFFGSVFFFFGTVARLAVGDHQKKGNIAIIELLGEILEARAFVEELQELKKDDAVKAVVIRVDSPGGSVGAAQEIFEAVKSFKEKKPIVVSMGTVAASGGYYVSAPATKIVANRGTITGSIGVRMDLVNVEDLLLWARLKAVTLKSGALKDVGSPTRPMTEEEKAYLEDVLRRMHGQFKVAIRESRGLSEQEMDLLADGRIFTGEEAQANKLVDELGPLEKAVQLAAQAAGITGEPETFYSEPEPRNWMDYFAETFAEHLIGKATTLISGRGRFSYTY